MLNKFKHMTIEANPEFLKAWYMENLDKSAEFLAVKVVEDPTLCYGAVAMRRNELQSNQEILKKSIFFLYILPTADVVQLLNERQLTRHMAAKRESLGGRVKLVVLDPADYFKDSQPEADLQKAIVDLIMTLQIDVLIVEDPDELRATIIQYMKASA